MFFEWDELPERVKEAYKRKQKVNAKGSLC